MLVLGGVWLIGYSVLGGISMNFHPKQWLSQKSSLKWDFSKIKSFGGKMDERMSLVHTLCTQVSWFLCVNKDIRYWSFLCIVGVSVTWKKWINKKNIGVFLHRCEWEPANPLMDHVWPSIKVGLLPSIRKVNSQGGGHSLVYFAYTCDTDLLKWGLFTYEKGL